MQRVLQHFGDEAHPIAVGQTKLHESSRGAEGHSHWALSGLPAHGTHGILSTELMMAERNLSVTARMFLMELSSRVLTSS